MDTCLQREHVREGVVEEVVARRDAVIAQGDGTELPGGPSSFIHHFIQMKLSIGGCLRRRLELDRIERLVRDADGSADVYGRSQVVETWGFLADRNRGGGSEGKTTSRL